MSDKLFTEDPTKDLATIGSFVLYKIWDELYPIVYYGAFNAPHLKDFDGEEQHVFYISYTKENKKKLRLNGCHFDRVEGSIKECFPFLPKEATRVAILSKKDAHLLWNNLEVCAPSETLSLSEQIDNLYNELNQ